MAEITTGTGIHSGDDHNRTGIGQRSINTGNSYHAVLHWLTQNFHNVAFEFGQFIEKQYAIVRQRNFAGMGDGTAAGQTC